MSPSSPATVAPIKDQAIGGRVLALDGVRGVAILSVLLFHTDSVVLRAGYLGVDVFFVLSGFLIADILYRNLSKSAALPVLANFWLRRARRLAPALLMLIAVVCLLRLVLPEAGNADRGPILAALTYTTNWYEIVSGGNYFGQFQPPSLLFHTWSLAIEEQFYLAFPFVLLAAMRLMKTRRLIVALLATLAVGSAVWMAVLERHGASELRLYMGTDTRVQALLLGAALGVLMGTAPRSRGSALARATGPAGLVVLLIVMAFSNRVTSLMSGGFFLVAMASAMVIASALRPGPIQLVLAWTPMVWLGRISYSLYLWHYPVFDWVQGGAPGSVAVGAQLWSAVLSVLVAWLSYALVEQKILRGAFTRWPVRRQWLAYVLAASAILVLVLPPAGLRQTKTDLSWPAVDQLPTSLLVMGDSTGYEADRFFPRDVYPAMIVGGTHYIGCGLSDLPYRLSTGDKDVKKCQEWPQLTSEYHERWTPGAAAIFSVVWDSFDRVVEGESYPPGTREFDDDFTRNLAEAVQAAGRDGRYPVYVVKATCLDAQFEETVLNDSNRRNTINRLVDAVVASLPNAQAVDTSWLTCRDGRPAEEMGDSWVRRDGVHWSEEGLRRLWQYILTDISQRQ